MGKKSSKNTKTLERPERLRTRFSRTPDELTIVYAWRSFGIGMFLLFFLAVWTFACVLLIYRVLEKPELMRILFGSVFWLSWVVVFICMIATILGSDYIRIDRESLTYINRVIFAISRRRIPLSEVRRISIENRKQNSDSAATTPLIVIETLGSPITICSGVPREELDWLADQLNDATGLSRRIEAPDDPVQYRGNSFESTLSIVDRPSECTWQLRQDFDGLVFFQRGKFSVFAIFASLMLCAFWNGIVSVFIMNLLGYDDNPPRGIEWIGRAIFLTPFVLVGLLFVFLFILTLLEPLRVTSWSFTSNSIDCAWRWLGLGPHWHYDVNSLQSMTVEKSKRRKSKGEDETDENCSYCIRFHADAAKEICTFDSLHEGEARWIAENVRRILPTR